MKLLKRNCKEFEYYAYTGLDSDLNSDGLHTGVWQPIYADPVTYVGNISTPSGSAVQAFDGLDIRYSHVLVMDDPDADIEETGYVRYKGKRYDITAVRPSLNVLSVALRQRTKNHGDQYFGFDDAEPDVSSVGDA